jgi:hypothetical protein
VQCALAERLVTEQRRRREHRRVVPYLPVGHPLVERSDQRDTWRDDAIAHALAQVGHRRRRGPLLQQVEGDAELHEPDRLEIRAEERPRWTEHVVGIGIGEVLHRPRLEQVRREHLARGVAEQHRQERRVHRALGEPELVPVEAEAIVLLAVPLATASRTAMPLVERMIRKQRAVTLAAAATARQQRLCRGHLVWGAHQRLEL